MAGLSDDMIKLILLRLPIKSLLRFQRVCKHWRDLIQDSKFIKEHMDGATPVFVWNRNYITHSDFKTTPNRHVFAAYEHRCNGFSTLAIFEGLVVEQYSTSLRVRNPATRKALSLPPLPRGCLSREMNFKLDSCTNVATWLGEYDASNSESLIRETGFKILGIGEDRHWRTFVRKDIEMALGNCVREDIHFVYTVENGPGQVLLQVSSYDKGDKSFFISNFPQDNFFANPHELHHFWWNNSLAIGVISEEELRFLVLEKQHGDQEGNDKYYKWSESQIVVQLRFSEENMDLKEELVPVEASSDELWLHSQGKYKLCYDMKAGIIKEVQPLKGERVKMLKYQPSLKNLEGMEDVGNNPYY